VRLSGHGLAIELPDRWEGRIYRRPGGHPILHAGSFRLPQDDADFGTQAIQAMGGADAFLALLEYEPSSAGTPLFNEPRIPRPVHASDLSPKAFARRIPGRLGVQRFFTVHGTRPFCLYLVVSKGLAAPAATPLAVANEVLGTLSIDAGIGSAGGEP
jgi:hypothetical protein